VSKGSKKLPLFDPQWLPLLKKPSPSPTRAPKGGAKQGAPLKHDWVTIVIEIAFRAANATKKEQARSNLAEAKSVQRWCVRQLKQKPALSDLREIVKAVRRRFSLPE
jgi:hypothetical protein